MKVCMFLAYCTFTTLAMAEDKKNDLPKHKSPEQTVQGFLDTVFDKRGEIVNHLSDNYKKKFIAQNVRTTAESLVDEPFLNIRVIEKDKTKFIAELQPFAKKYKFSPKSLRQIHEDQSKIMRGYKPTGDKEKHESSAIRLFVEFLDSMLKDVKDPDAFHKEYIRIFQKNAADQSREKYEQLKFKDVKIKGDRATLYVLMVNKGQKEQEPIPFAAVKQNGRWVVDLSFNELSF